MAPVLSHPTLAMGGGRLHYISRPLLKKKQVTFPFPAIGPNTLFHYSPTTQHCGTNPESLVNMSYNKEKAQEVEQKVIKIRITITSTDVKKVERACNSLVERSKELTDSVAGPIRLPTKVLKITTRKTPNGEGSKTWDSYEMRIHKRLVDIVASGEMVKQVTSYNMEAGVNIEVTIAQ